MTYEDVTPIPFSFAKKVALAEIQQTEITATKFIYGWGIHLTPQL